MDAMSKYAGETQAGMPISLTLAQRLDQAVHDAEIRLEKARKAREILNRYPDIEALIDHLRYI